MESSLPTIKKYISTCIAEDDEPSFEGFIVKHARHIRAYIDRSQDPFSDLLCLFLCCAKSFGIKVRKGFAQRAWRKHTERKVLCHTEEEEEVEGEWPVGEDDVVELFNQKRKTIVEQKKRGGFITESCYLLLSFVLEVPLSTKNFVFGSKDHCLKMMRSELMPMTRKPQFQQDILVMFLNVKKAWEAKSSEEDEDEEDEDEEEDVDYQIYLMTKKAKKSKKKEEDALSRVLAVFLNKFRNWKKDYTAKPDFFLFCPFEGEDFGLLCVEVKKPGCTITQSLSDRSKLALEMKRSIDNQALLGVQTPKCFGLLVDGLVVTSFAAEINSHGIYTFLELEEFSLLREKSDLGILPDVVLCFCWNLVDEAAASIGKRRKTVSDEGCTPEKLLRATVALPVQKSNCE
ncbi:hypothetical protein A0J61_10489 [Choanephora cucurbitarum]|uniref:Uncharacterized protein n=1 Tax=Choanephora cucurbitarum TaxID=101091 RepID=A0A1C7MXC0_9FUNG|nr:hypothetical protein A0J61_10489 [Choanephora cucurbitarum]